MSDALKRSKRGNEESEARKVTLPPTLFLQRQLIFNREASWLEFNRRVLEEALDRSHPLLERLKFLSIFSTNLDEFFMIRVSGLKEQLDQGVTELSVDGMSPAAQLKLIWEQLRPMTAEHARCLKESVMPELAENGIVVTNYRALSDKERRTLSQYFMENVFPVLTPQAVDPSHPFPYISNLSLNIGVMIEPDRPDSAPAAPAEMRFARVKVPPSVPRLVPVGESGTFTFLEELIAANSNVLFPGMKVSEFHAFRVTRDADIEIREDEANDLLRTMEQELRKRRFGTAVRLEVSAKMPGEMVRYLASSLHLKAEDVYTVDDPLNIPDLMALYKLDRTELKDKPFSAS